MRASSGLGFRVNLKDKDSVSGYRVTIYGHQGQDSKSEFRVGIQGQDSGSGLRVKI